MADIQLHGAISEVDAGSTVVAALAALEGTANPNLLCAEWVARVFLDLPPLESSDVDINSNCGGGEEAEAGVTTPASSAAAAAAVVVSARPASFPAQFFDGASVSPLFNLSCRSHRGPGTCTDLPAACPHKHEQPDADSTPTPSAAGQ